MAGVSGDFAALKDFADKVKDVGAAAEEIAQKASPRLRQSLQGSLSNQVDPYGQAWPPFKTPPTGVAGYMSSIDTAAQGKSIVFEVQPPLTFHHDGVPGHMPPRPVIPDEGRGIPPNMVRILKSVAEDVMSKAGAAPAAGGE